MKNISTILSLVIMLLCTGIIVKFFLRDQAIAEILTELNTTKQHLTDALNSNSKAEEQIKLLEGKLDTFNLKNELLNAYRDSIVTEQKRKYAATYDELIKIKDEQKIINAKLVGLREETKGFK